MLVKRISYIHPFTNNTYSIVGKMTTTFLLVFSIDFVGKMHASQLSLLYDNSFLECKKKIFVNDIPSNVNL